MDRLKNLVLGSAHAFDDNESLVSNDYNWNDISIGNDTIGCEKFFRVPAAEFEQALNDINEDINNVQIVFEDTVENSENTSDIMNTPNSVDSKARTSVSSEDDAISQAASKHVPARNLAVEVRRQPLGNHCRSNVPNVVLAGQRYEQRKKQRMAEVERVEREQRQFHAKKVPNFHSIHAARNARRAIEVKVTVPVTPRVVHNHRKNLERVRAKQQEAEAARQPKPFVAKTPDVLTSAPFVPHHHTKSPTEIVPFNLHSDERLRERHQFDEQYKLEVERREKEQEEKRKADEEQIRREIRKATTFKARPNPFS